MADRNTKICNLRARGFTLRALADIFHLSPERIRQIVAMLKRRQKSGGGTAPL